MQKQVFADHGCELFCSRELEKLAQDIPNAVALLAPGGEPLTFSHLRTRIVSVARALREAGVTSGDIVAVAMPQGPEALITLLAVPEVTAVAPLDCNLTEAEFHLRLSAMPVACLLTCAGPNSSAVAAAQRLGIPVLEAHFMASGEVCLSSARTPAE